MKPGDTEPIPTCPHGCHFTEILACTECQAEQDKQAILDEAGALAPVATELIRRMEEETTRVLCGSPATTSESTGVRLSVADLETAYRRMDDAMPWRRWLGKAELKADEAGMLPESIPVLVVTPPTGWPELGTVVMVRPLVLESMRKAMLEALTGVPFVPVAAVSDRELAAILAWLAAGRRPPEPSIGCGIRMDGA